jgi:hypothetical protein
MKRSGFYRNLKGKSYNSSFAQACFRAVPADERKGSADPSAFIRRLRLCLKLIRQTGKAEPPEKRRSEPERPSLFAHRAAQPQRIKFVKNV